MTKLSILVVSLLLAGLGLMGASATCTNCDNATTYKDLTSDYIIINHYTISCTATDKIAAMYLVNTDATTTDFSYLDLI